MDTELPTSWLRPAMAAVDAADAATPAEPPSLTETAATTTVPAAGKLEHLSKVHRAAIENHEQSVITVRRERDIAIRALDDELFDAERAFIALRSRIERQRAETIAEAAIEIAAHDRIAQASQAALVALTKGGL